ncbi:MAG: MarR family transcriptional regulator [Rhodobiaceae bacterium]|nr:MarR family transcriptional regulator [Rhodobiaceae bacterium]
MDETPARHSHLRLWLRLFANVALVERELRERLRKQHGVSLAKFDYLAQLYRAPQGTLTMGQLGQQLMVSGGNITGLTDRLAADGLVRRKVDPDDRRVQQVVLTGDGTALFEVMARDHEGWVNQLLSGLDAGEADDLLLGLKRMKQAVQAVLAEENAPSEA